MFHLNKLLRLMMIFVTITVHEADIKESSCMKCEAGTTCLCNSSV